MRAPIRRKAEHRPTASFLVRLPPATCSFCLSEALSIEGWSSWETEVVLLGGGNSAGQAVVYLATVAKKVWLLARRPLAATMSRYLIERISGLPNVEVVSTARITAVEGHGGALEAVRWQNGEAEVRRPIRHVFLFIGADPNTDWLSGSGVSLDKKGFGRTGAELGLGYAALETSRPGVFAIGDVRAGSVKRVAAAVEDGAQVVATLHALLAAAGVTT